MNRRTLPASFILLGVIMLTSDVIAGRPYCPTFGYRTAYCGGFYYINNDNHHDIDTACVDFCIDKRHTLNQCTAACTN